jgi:phage tail protein X
MAGRYDKATQSRDSKGRRYIPTTLYPNIPFDSRDIYVRTVAGDRLDLLAYQFYNNLKYWWIIAHANNVGKGTMVLAEGTQLRIPANPSTIQTAFDLLNTRTTI